MKIVNLTPHDITVRSLDGTVTTYPSAGVARLAETRRDSGVLVPAGADPGQGIQVSLVEYGEVTGLPDPEKNVVYITSQVVAQHVRRPDVLSPGPLVRDDQGRPVGCDGLTAWAPEDGA